MRESARVTGAACFRARGACCYPPIPPPRSPRVPSLPPTTQTQRNTEFSLRKSPFATMEWFSLKSIRQQTTKESFIEECDVKIKTQCTGFIHSALLITCYVHFLPSFNQAPSCLKWGKLRCSRTPNVIKVCTQLR